jgi:hypothetical protein
MTKGKFSARISEEDRKLLEVAYEKKQKDFKDDWSARWDWRKQNSSFGAFVIEQAKRQTKADFPSPIVLEIPVQKPKRNKKRKPGKKRGR